MTDAYAYEGGSQLSASARQLGGPVTTTLTISYGMTEPEAEARSTLDTILEQERQKVADLRAVLSSQMEPGAGLRATPTCNSTDADPRGTASSSFHVPDFSPALLVPSQHSTLVLDVECIRYAKLVLASVADLRKALPYDSTVAVLSAEYVASLPPEAAFPDEAVGTKNDQFCVFSLTYAADGYLRSMDRKAMALHTLWFSKSKAI